jgi:hypothetical protein
MALICFDWDDTLFPTTCFHKLELDPPPIHVRVILKYIDQAALAALTCADDMGQVVIVTNAMASWVESTASNYLPATNKFILDHQIPIFSAATLFRERSNCYIDWKYFTFEKIVGEYSKVSTFISIGDAPFERSATIRLGVRYPIYKVKTLKLINTPNFTELYCQLRHAAEMLPDFICSKNYPSHVDFQV